MTDHAKLLSLTRNLNIAKARRSFWHFCKVDDPAFYLESRPHLIILALTLESFYRGEPVEHVSRVRYDGRIKLSDPFKGCVTWQDYEYDSPVDGGKVKGTLWRVDVKTKDGERCKHLAINVPPRHGKSRTLFLFTAWLFGVDPSYKVGTYSYNSKMAQDFSRYTRDKIGEDKRKVTDIIYNDIWPKTKLKRGDQSYGKWSLEGEFFNYMGAGWETGFTGRGFDLIIGDDPIKSSLEAFNEAHLEKMEATYKNSIHSRLEGGSDDMDDFERLHFAKKMGEKEGLEILNLTRWSQKDLVGINLDGPNGHLWQVCKMEAWTEKQGMLCKGMLNRERYEYLKSELDEMIFYANYHQDPPVAQGRLYKTILHYDKLPENFERIIAYCDTADKGEDYLCCIVAGVLNDEIYILGVYYSQDGMDTTEPELAEFLLGMDEKYSFISVKFEANSGGERYGKAVSESIEEIDRYNTITFEYFTQSDNKEARILSASGFVQRHVFFPMNWKTRWPQFYKDLTGYLRVGKNLHDDAPDTLTGLVEMIGNENSVSLLTKYREGNI